MGGIIFIGIIMSNVFGFGIISTYHLSFEVTLQERVMRFQMQEKFSKWGNNENKTKLFKDWIEQMNFVQEEYRLFTAYAEERKGTGEKGLKVTKISENGTADNTGVNQSEVTDDSCYYQDTLDSVELLEFIPEGKSLAQMEEDKLKGKQAEVMYLMNDM